MSDLGPDDVLFMGMGRTHVAWYRCFLPALALKSDWIGYAAAPPSLRSATGFVRGELKEPVFTDYKILIVQQPRGPDWAKWITEMQALGIKVLYEVDDDLTSVSKMKSHSSRKKILKHVHGYELCMLLCDGIIASTPTLAKKLARFNKCIWVCEAGIDTERYQLKRPGTHPTRYLGFAGGFGHEQSLKPWVPGINKNISDDVHFMCVGMDYTGDVVDDGAISLPFTQVEAWPSVLSNFDIMLAPGGKHPFFQSKSELKWIEASAMGIPVIASSIPYASIEHMKTGIKVDDVSKVGRHIDFLLRHPEAGAEMAQAAREAVLERWHITNRLQQWIDVFEAVT